MFKVRLFIAFIVFGISLTVFSIYSFSIVVKERQLNQKVRISNEVLLKKEHIISSFIEHLDNKLYSISKNDIFKRFKKDLSSQRYIKELFKTMMMSEKSIYQLRYLNNSGQEIIRLDSVKNNIVVVAQDKLQNKSNRYYFKEIKQLPIDSIWHSYIDLNMENGKIEQPIKPVLRIGLNNKNGILIINVLVDDIKSIVENGAYKTYLVDGDGEFLLHSNSDYSWSKYLNLDVDLKTSLNIDNLSFLTYDRYSNDDFTSIRISAINRDKAILILKYPENVLSEIKGNFFNIYINIFISTVLLSIILAYIFSKPITKLNEKLESLNTDLDKKVEKRTKELDDSLSLVDKYVIRSSTTLNGNIIEVSDAFCKVSGYTKEELIGQPHSIVRHTDMKKEIFRNMWNTITSGSNWDGEIKSLTKDGGYYWVQVHIEPNFNDKQEITSYTAIMHNITDKKELELQKEQNDVIIKFANSGIGTMDLEGNFLSVNDVYTKLFGYSQEEMIGKNCIDMAHKDYVELSKLSLKIANEVGTLNRVEKTCKHKNGRNIYIEMSLDLLPDRKNFVVVINSLEDKIKLQKLNKSLETKIKKEVEKSTKQLKEHQEEQINNAKLTSIGTLAAGITHEINTPLTYIKGNFEMMGYDIDDLPSSDIKLRMLEDKIKIQDGIDRIAKIIEAMREVSQVSRELKEEVDICNTIITALTISYNRSKQISRVYINDNLFTLKLKNNFLTFKSLVQKQRLEQVWIIIVNNALDELIKIDDYEKRELKIYIKENKDKIIISFKDNGGGINNDILDKIFEPFSSNKDYSGMGIGLNIAQKIIDEQDGTIKAYNENDGAVFEINLSKQSSNI